MRFFAVALTVSVSLGCGGSSARHGANSPDEENSEEVSESDPESDEAERSAEADQDGDEERSEEGSRPAKKRKPKQRRHVETAPQPEPPPMYRKPLPPPPAPTPPAEEATPAYADSADQGDTALEAEARKRCHWKNVAPYRPEWANAISPPLAQRRKITSKPICPYGTPPNVLRVARQIAVQQTKLKQPR
jgi:hypothetical protein